MISHATSSAKCIPRSVIVSLFLVNISLWKGIGTESTVNWAIMSSLNYGAMPLCQILHSIVQCAIMPHTSYLSPCARKAHKRNRKEKEKLFHGTPEIPDN